MPRPGIKKICSMITTPPSSPLSCRPRTVTAGIAAFLNAYFTTVFRVPVPTESAVRT